MKLNEFIHRLALKSVVHHGWTIPFAKLISQLTPFQLPPVPESICLPLLPPGPDGVYK